MASSGSRASRTLKRETWGAMQCHGPFRENTKAKANKELLKRTCRYPVDGPHEAYEVSVGKNQRNRKGYTCTRATANAVKWDHRWRRWAEGCSTSEACYFNWIQRASFGTCLSWLHWPFPFPKAAWVLKLIGCENKSDEVSQEPSPIFLWRIYSLVPLFARYVDRIVVQQLLASLEKRNIFSLPT